MQEYKKKHTLKIHILPHNIIYNINSLNISYNIIKVIHVFETIIVIVESPQIWTSTAHQYHDIMINSTKVSIKLHKIDQIEHKIKNNNETMYMQYALNMFHCFSLSLAIKIAFLTRCHSVSSSNISTTSTKIYCLPLRVYMKLLFIQCYRCWFFPFFFSFASTEMWNAYYVQVVIC